MDEKYPMETAAQGYGSNSALVGSARRMDITLRQNIDDRIKQAQAHVVELEQTKDRMEKSGILDMRIDDIRRAMQF
jgi:hypothetical protein